MIKLQIPERAIQLMTCKTISEAFDGLIKNRGCSLMDLLTFGGVITPIIDNETNQPEAYVAYWFHNGQVTVCQLVEKEQLKLLGVETLPSPSCEEALQLYYKYRPAPESSMTFEEAAQKIIDDDLSLDVVEVWLKAKERCDSSELVEKVAAWLLVEARSEKGWADHYFKKSQAADLTDEQIKAKWLDLVKSEPGKGSVYWTTKLVRWALEQR